MDESFRIYVEQLRGGKTEKINESFSPSFMEVEEKDLRFTRDVHVTGEAYLAEEDLILHLDITAFAVIPCSMCNEPVETPVEIRNFYHTVPLSEVKGAIYDFREIVRETILLDVPKFVECGQGKCVKRGELSKFLKKEPENGKKSDDDEGYHPFADIDLDKFK